MTPEQIKAAREWFRNLAHDNGSLRKLMDDEYTDILKTLDIVEKLMGEPSEGMLKAFRSKIAGFVCMDTLSRAMKAMRDQLLKECE